MIIQNIERNNLKKKQWYGTFKMLVTSINVMQKKINKTKQNKKNKQTKRKKVYSTLDPFSVSR